MDARTVSELKDGVKHVTHLCPKCSKKLVYFSGNEGIPEYLWCMDCTDAAYSLDGKKLANLY